MLGQLQQYYGALTRTAVIPNGRDPSRFVYEQGSKEPLILCAGRLWDRAKNVEVLTAAAPAVRWPVCVAGAGVAPGGDTAPLSGLRMLGLLDPPALAQWYARASIYVLPARYEPFGLTALEAGLSGCALVLGDIASLHEVWGDAALYVPPDDPEQITATLNRLIADDRLRSHLAAQSRKRAMQFSPRQFVDGYLGLYGELIGEHQAATAVARKRAGPPAPGADRPNAADSPGSTA
jgi:glycosyltransferase involved in cell wall biosynthesis